MQNYLDSKNVDAQNVVAVKHNLNLDILRGVAAFTVVCFHLISGYSSAFDQNFELSHFINYNFPGHMSVLVFFILSGYVISVNTKRLTDKRSIADYLRKRIIRILPIYVLAMLFTFAITYGHYSWSVILSNMFLVSVPFNNVIVEDGPLWSLNYEMIYYFIFIFFSYFAISMKKTVMVISILLATMFIFFHNVKINLLIISYLIGFLFWASGAMIAEIKTWPHWEISASRLIAVMLLIFCLQPFNPYGPILKVLHLPVIDYTSGNTFSEFSWYQQSISWTDIFYYPLAILLILALTRSYSSKHRILLYFIYSIAIFRMVMIFKVYGINFIIREYYVAPGLILLLSLVFWMANFNIKGRLQQMLKSVSSIGSVSYGVYIIHMPLIYFFGMKWHTNSWLFFSLKLVVYFLILLLLSYLLELKFQPFIKSLLRKTSGTSSAKNI